MRAALPAMLAAALLAGCYGAVDNAEPAVEMGEAWLENFLGDQKIGYSVLRYDRFQEGFRFDDLLTMEIAMGDKPQKVTSRSVVTTDKDLFLQSFHFRFESQDRHIEARGAVQGNGINVRVEGDDTPRVVKLDGPVYPMAALGRLAVTGVLGGDSVRHLDVFDVTMMSVVNVGVSVEGRDTIDVSGVRQEIVNLRTRLPRFAVVSWIDESGMTVREEMPPNMRAERVTPDAALSGRVETATTDLLKMFRVRVDTLVPRPESVRRLRLEVTGMSPEDAGLEYDSQRVLSQNPLIVEVVVPEVPDTSLSLPMSAESGFLAPSVSIQCDDPRILRSAHEATGGSEDAEEAARRLVLWVYESLEKEPTASFPTALDVLRHMKGDCNEHAVFLAALARSIGIPAKVAVGLVYMNGAFYYHAWNEVFLGRWLPVDATFGEFPASAMRLKLGEGEVSQQAEILGVVGRIRLRILEFEQA